ncbi:hypothetical protein DPMN_176153 [Dreissena polymorpha]|uniref:Secreted protein n=1 Tax=Dreissena polymorpha TaxID=45954 RepID=A0A9D4E915_DREPO|nr:hypothetical protein DPMN_176153 [Dreissena polymorpha]
MNRPRTVPMVLLVTLIVLNHKSTLLSSISPGGFTTAAPRCLDLKIYFVAALDFLIMSPRRFKISKALASYGPNIVCIRPMTNQNKHALIIFVGIKT